MEPFKFVMCSLRFYLAPSVLIILIAYILHITIHYIICQNFHMPRKDGFYVAVTSTEIFDRKHATQWLYVRPVVRTVCNKRLTFSWHTNFPYFSYIYKRVGIFKTYFWQVCHGDITDGSPTWGSLT